MELNDFKNVENLKKYANDILDDLKNELPKINNSKKDDCIRAFNKYFVDAFKIDFVSFNDRISRRVFWMFVFFSLIIGLLLSPFGFLLKAFFLVTLIPLVVLAIKRIHDIDFSGFWLILVFDPFHIGFFIVMFLLALPGDIDDNRFGKPIK